MMPGVRTGLAALLLAALLPAAAPAQDDPPDPTTEAEAPDPGAPPGAEPTATVSRSFDRYALPVRPFTASEAGTRTVHGAVTMSALRLDDPEATTAGIVAGYRERLSAKGFEPVLDCANEACGGFDFRFGVTLLPAPRMLMDAADFAQLTMRHGAPAEEPVWVSVLASRVLGVIHIQTVTVRESAEAPLITEAPERGEEILVLPQSLDTLRDRLLSDGHVRVEGLAFDEGGATLSPGSSPALDLLAELLKRHPEMRVAIVGHSDNSGALEPNIELSRRRAEAVERALVGRTVPQAQVESYGAGWLAPLTANDTEAGRALNRRVELVLR